MAWDPDSSEQDVGFALCEELYREVSPSLTEPRIKRVDEELELRARVGGTPVRVKVSSIRP